MPADPQRDWLDEMLAREPGWVPPADFPARLAALAVRMISVPAIQRRGRASSVAGVTRCLAGEMGLRIGARVEGVLWVARQYWLIVLRYS